MKTKDMDQRRGIDSNPDPITGASGAHPIGTGMGATGGALAGAALGAVAGPVGAAVGIVAGGIAGGLAGKGVAEQIDPTMEDTYWRDNYASRPYVDRDATYDTYAPAYRVGYEGRQRYANSSYDEVETDLQRDYNNMPDSARLTWEKAKHAVRDGWHRIEEELPGDADRDGR
ncbi:MAG: hypothetical protein SGI88_00150 [Candidatus Hydrogenedentes bacterium]|nr:hypothetical protein [Candidatus Hydrogenedentota bacterium]